MIYIGCDCDHPLSLRCDVFYGIVCCVSAQKKLHYFLFSEYIYICYICMLILVPSIRKWLKRRLPTM